MPVRTIRGISSQSERQAFGKDAFASTLRFEIQCSRFEQIVQCNHTHKRVWRSALDNREPGETCLCHPVDDDAQRLVGIGHHRIMLYEVGQLARAAFPFLTFLKRAQIASRDDAYQAVCFVHYRIKILAA